MKSVINERLRQKSRHAKFHLLLLRASQLRKVGFHISSCALKRGIVRYRPPCNRASTPFAKAAQQRRPLKLSGTSLCLQQATRQLGDSRPHLSLWTSRRLSQARFVLIPEAPVESGRNGGRGFQGVSREVPPSPVYLPIRIHLLIINSHVPAFDICTLYLMPADSLIVPLFSAEARR